jgi:PEP-CTERM motif
MRLPTLTLLAAIASAGSLRAGIIVDQEYTDKPNVAYNQGNPIFHPFGQSFTPGLAAVDFVQLRLSDFDAGSGLGGTFQVRIREGGAATGAILGTSAAKTLPDGFGTLADDFGYGFAFGGSLAQFDFATPVALNPGALYSIEVVELSGDRFEMYGTLPGGYPGGTAIAGLPLSSVDFFFREGIQDVPEPGTFGLGLFGVLLFGLAVFRRRRGWAKSIGVAIFGTEAAG